MSIRDIATVKYQTIIKSKNVGSYLNAFISRNKSEKVVRETHVFLNLCLCTFSGITQLVPSTTVYNFLIHYGT